MLLSIMPRPIKPTPVVSVFGVISVLNLPFQWDDVSVAVSVPSFARKSDRM